MPKIPILYRIFCFFGVKLEIYETFHYCVPDLRHVNVMRDINHFILTFCVRLCFITPTPLKNTQVFSALNANEII